MASDNTGPLCPGCKHRAGRHVGMAGGCLVSSGSGDRETFCVCEMTPEEIDAVLAWRSADRNDVTWVEVRERADAQEREDADRRAERAAGVEGA